jgi:zona occludens toxin
VYLVEEWQHWATFGSLIVIDEVQRVWRPSNKVPDDVAGLETHRHKGLDFWLISQGPHLFHSNVRLLITRHIHLVADWKGRKEFEFPECRQNVTNRSDAVERPYKLPKKIFGLYKSSTLHIKQSHRKPLSFYFMCASIAVFFVLLGFAAKRWNARQHPDTAAAGEARAKAVAPPAAASPGLPVQPAKPAGFPDFRPQIEGVPESAPAYAELNKVQNVPHISSCVKTPDWCRCYAGRGAVYPTSRAYCEERIKGNYFDPWRPPPARELKSYPISKPEPIVTAKNP